MTSGLREWHKGQIIRGTIRDTIMKGTIRAGTIRKDKMRKGRMVERGAGLLRKANAHFRGLWGAPYFLPLAIFGHP